jgi:hypothetical protein
VFFGPERLPIIYVDLPNHPIRIRAVIVLPEQLRCVCPGYLFSVERGMTMEL